MHVDLIAVRGSCTLTYRVVGRQTTRAEAGEVGAVAQRARPRFQEEQADTANEGDGGSDGGSQRRPRRTEAASCRARLGEARTAAPGSEHTDRKDGQRDEPAPTEELTVTWYTVGWAAAAARTGGVRTQWAVAPTAGVLRLTWWRGVSLGPRPPAGRGR